MPSYPYQQWNFGGPDFDAGYDPEGMAAFVRPRRDRLRQQGQDFQRDIINLQTQNRMKEFDQQLKAQTDYEKRQRDEQVTDRNLAASVGGAGSSLGQPRVNPLGPPHDLFAERKEAEQLQAGKAQQDLQNQYERERIDVAKRNSDTLAAQRAEPNYTFERVPGGNIIGIDKNSGRRIDTGIPSGILPQGEAIKEKGEQSRENIAAQGAQSRENIAASGAQARETKQTPPAPTPVQEKQGIANRANILRQSNPRWANWIQVDANGNVGISPAGTNGLTEHERAVIVQALVGPQVQRPGTPPAQPGVPQAPQPQPAPNSYVGSKRPLPAGKIRVQDKNGTFYFWDANKPVPQGFKVVRDK